MLQSILEREFSKVPNVYLLTGFGEYVTGEDPLVLGNLAGPRFVGELYTKVASILSVSPPGARSTPFQDQ